MAAASARRDGRTGKRATPRRRQRLLPSIAGGLALAFVGAACPARAVPGGDAWRREPRLPAQPDATSLAASGGRLAVGDDRGVWLLEDGAPAQRAWRGAPVRALAFDGPALWIGSEDGLFRLEGGRARDAGPAPGAARRVLALAVGADGPWVGTEGGVYRPVSGSPAAARSLRAEPRLGRGAVAALAFHDGALHAAVGRAWRVLDAAGELREVPLPVGLGAPQRVVAGPDGVWALTSRGLAQLVGDALHVHRLALPPGTEPTRVARCGDGLWLGSATGLLATSAGAPGVAARAAEPLGTARVVDLAVDDAGLHVLTARGVFALPRAACRLGAAAAAPAVPPPAAARPALRRRPSPPVLAVHRAALRHLALGPERMQALARGVARRGLLPELELRGGYGGGRDHGWRYDESFSSGAVHRLNDRDGGHSRDFDVLAVLRWDLGDLAYHPEQVDVARETREWIELRDEVLDEITQLYFARCRALEEAERAPDAAERARQALRAAELAAGLDAWTGGWWSAQAAASASPSRPPGPEPEVDGCDPF